MTLELIHAELAERCAQIAKLFSPGARITILVRNPHHGHGNSADLLVGDDQPEEIIKSVQYLSTREERKLQELHLREQISSLPTKDSPEERQQKETELKAK